ncbi:adenylate/guanylate cyclase domain-containing protein [Arthrobacter sp. B1I2]|uniref:adenylate/guanylate cyclase domain-containing protein n=1 Tax=Arthrobacter sp. B1I2 TaxID=3042263 RepID=UPI0027829DEA|nr:adenylate/guanylate cyclase domain-containing protein [Arthrobacter sp. B1I2]MDQ0730440.1 adenylate cyclase [Arthrobacter sp. B1I2]
MALKADVESDIVKTVNTSLTTTERNDGTIESVPDPAKMSYSEGLYLPSTYLYADMRDSSGLVGIAPADTVARVMKAYLSVSTRIIRSNNGHIRSFDGDRVMGIYAGPDRYTRAVKSAMQIKWAMNELVQPAITKQFPSIRNNNWQLKHGCGIASGKSLLVRAGFRGNDDMISIGTAPNLAAKLSDLREHPYNTIIGGGTYKQLSREAIVHKEENMWTGPYDFKMGGKNYTYYKTSYRWRI